MKILNDPIENRIRDLPASTNCATAYPSHVYYVDIFAVQCTDELFGIAWRAKNLLFLRQLTVRSVQ